MQSSLSSFQNLVWQFYRQHSRSMPWREQPTPYYVVVSEIMLQQTQVTRVIPKFNAFIAQFPTFADLASAPLEAVLRAWSGLGYNRRAKFLWQLAGIIVTEYNSKLPQEIHTLVKLPGIGRNTAGAIAVYAFKQPVVFIETNVRTVYLHHFFPNRHAVNDSAIIPLIAQTLDHQRPHEWYWALMDYGTHLKQTLGNNTHRSQHYTKQSRFAGSRRQLRGQVIKQLLNHSYTQAELAAYFPDARLPEVLAQLLTEKLIHQQEECFSLAP